MSLLGGFHVSAPTPEERRQDYRALLVLAVVALACVAVLVYP